MKELLNNYTDLLPTGLASQHVLSSKRQHFIWFKQASY